MMLRDAIGREAGRPPSRAGRRARFGQWALKAAALVLLLAAAALGGAQADIVNIQQFLDQCPNNDPAYAQIRRDVKIRRNGRLVREIPCTEPVSQMPLSQYTDELITLQILRTIYYLDRGRSGHLPWTSGA